MDEIKLRLTVKETNLILEALGNLPFARVYELIGKIQQQAEQQFPSNDEHPNTEVPSTNLKADE